MRKRKSWNFLFQNFNGPRFTNQGKFALGLLILSGFFIFFHPSNTLYFLFALAFSVFLLHAGYSWFALKHISVSREIPSAVFSGEILTVFLKIHYTGWLPLYGIWVEDGRYSVLALLEIKFFLPQLLRCQVLEIQYQTSLKKRGEVFLHSIRFSTRFPLGLFQKVVDIPCHSRILVYPALGSLKQNEIFLANFPQLRQEAFQRKGTSLEYAGVREYHYGDESRRIHWKLSARYQRNLIKEFHQPHNPQVFILLDNYLPSVCSQKDMIYLERAISFCATLAKRLLQRQYHVGFTTYLKEPIVLLPEGGNDHWFRILEVLSRVEPCILSHLEPLCALAQTSLPQTTPVFYVFPLKMSREESVEKMKQKVNYFGAKGLSLEKRKARRKIEREKRKTKFSCGEMRSYLDHLFLQLHPQEQKLFLGDFRQQGSCIYANDESFSDIFESERI